MSEHCRCSTASLQHIPHEFSIFPLNLTMPCMQGIPSHHSTAMLYKRKANDKSASKYAALRTPLLHGIYMITVCTKPIVYCPGLKLQANAFTGGELVLVCKSNRDSVVCRISVGLRIMSPSPRFRLCAARVMWLANLQRRSALDLQQVRLNWRRGGSSHCETRLDSDVRPWSWSRSRPSQSITEEQVNR